MKKFYSIVLLLLFLLVQNGFAQKSASTLELAAFFKSKRKVKDPVISVYNKAGQKVELKKGTTPLWR